MTTSEKGRKGKTPRRGELYAEEIALASGVYGDTLPYDRIFISATKSHTQGITLATSPLRASSKYLILWHDAHIINIGRASDSIKEIFIHELAHVWQSQFSGNSAMSFMSKSVWAQFSHGRRDIFENGLRAGITRTREMVRNGFLGEWDHHRNMAYQFDPKEIGKDFNQFNVEQQAMIVQTWYAKQPFSIRGVKYLPGHSSIQDSRFPYIRDCIRKGNPDARYIGIGIEDESKKPHSS